MNLTPSWVGFLAAAGGCRPRATSSEIDSDQIHTCWSGVIEAALDSGHERAGRAIEPVAVAWQSVSMESRDLARLRRWEDGGGMWRVTSRGRTWNVDLITCLGDETMECLRSDEVDLRRYIGDRDASDESE